MKATKWRKKGRPRWRGRTREEEGRKDEGMDDEGVGCEGSVQEGGFGWQASLNRPLFSPLLASLLMQNRPVQPPSHPSHNRKTMAGPLRASHSHNPPTISQPHNPAPNRGWVGNRSVYVCWEVGGWSCGIFSTEKVPLEEGPPRLRAGQKKQIDVTCFEAGWTSYWDPKEVRRG